MNRKIVLSDLKEMLGEPNVKLATEDDFAERFPDCELGAMPTCVAAFLLAPFSSHFALPADRTGMAYPFFERRLIFIVAPPPHIRLGLRPALMVGNIPAFIRVIGTIRGQKFGRLEIVANGSDPNRCQHTFRGIHR